MADNVLHLIDASVDRSIKGLSGTKKYRTTWDNKFDSSLPQPGDPYDNEFVFLRLSGYNYDRGDANECIITCRYDSENQRDTTFIERTLDFSAESMDTTQGCIWETLGAPVDIPVPVTYPLCELVITIQMETTPIDAIFSAVGKVNSATWQSCPAETLLFEGASVREQYNQAGELIGAQCSFKFLKRSYSHNLVKRAARQKLVDGIPQYYHYAAADDGKANWTNDPILDSSPVYVAGAAGLPGWDKPYWMDGTTKKYMYDSCDFATVLGIS